MDKKTKEELRHQITRLAFEAGSLAGHLTSLQAALDASKWAEVQSAVYRQNIDLRAVVSGCMALGQRLVKIAVSERVATQTPSQLADLTRTLLTKYLYVRGGVYEAIYAQLARGASLAPDTIGSFSMTDPEVADVCERMNNELFALAQSQNPTPDTLRLIDVLELSASALQLLCVDTPAAREQFTSALGMVLERHLADPATALELIVEA